MFDNSPNPFAGVPRSNLGRQQVKRIHKELVIERHNARVEYVAKKADREADFFQHSKNENRITAIAEEIKRDRPYQPLIKGLIEKIKRRYAKHLRRQENREKRELTENEVEYVHNRIYMEGNR
ncbi:MAG: hypothetical protein GY821_02345 [Gammaproteobacteria bacterium]|nr:hypothetical protein [Gammaproteobacteria bacterium]